MSARVPVGLWAALLVALAGACEPAGRARCSRATSYCSDSRTETRCRDDGSEWEEHRCREGETCFGGMCGSPVCLAGQVRCADDGKAELRCNDDGGDWTATPCRPWETCHDDACRPALCEPWALECLSVDRVGRCNTTGREWKTVEDCGAGRVCRDAACHPIVCAPDEVVCDDATHAVVTCDATGTAKHVRQACGDDELCLDGACLPWVCNAGVGQCLSFHQARTCNPWGTDWEEVQNCGVGEACREGQCVRVQCVPGDEGCSGDSLAVVKCDASGTTLEVVVDCADDQACRDAACAPATSRLGEILPVNPDDGAVALTPGYYAVALVDTDLAEARVPFPMEASGSLSEVEAESAAPTMSIGLPPTRFPCGTSARGFRPPTRSVTPVARVAAVPPPPSVGDVRTFHYEIAYGEPVEIEARLRSQGSFANLWEDLEAAPRGTQMSDFSLADLELRLDSAALPRVMALHGPPTDVDGNGRVDVLFTPRLPDPQAIAFVDPFTLFPEGTWSTPRDFGEIAYAAAPGNHASVRETASILAHEITHLVEAGVRLGPWLQRPDEVTTEILGREAYVAEGLAEVSAAWSGFTVLYSAMVSLSKMDLWRLGGLARSGYYSAPALNMVHYGLGAVATGYLFQQAGGVGVAGPGLLDDLGGIPYLRRVARTPTGIERLQPLDGRTHREWYSDLVVALMLDTLFDMSGKDALRYPARYVFPTAVPDRWAEGRDGIPLHWSWGPSIATRVPWSGHGAEFESGGAALFTLKVGEDGAQVRVTRPTTSAFLVRYRPQVVQATLRTPRFPPPTTPPAAP